MSAEQTPIQELIRASIAEAQRDEGDDDSYWEAIRRVQKCDAQGVFRLLAPLAHDTDARVRALVPDVLRYLGGEPRPLAVESVALLRTMLRDEGDPHVLAAIGHALGEIGLPERVELMRGFAGHASSEVRSAVVAALLRSRDERAVATLIALSRDPDDAVRDWATFGLGTQLGPTDPEQQNGPHVVDTDALRDALAARLDDLHDDTRCEAIVGLAMRRDPRVLPVLRDEIARGPEHSLVVEAARWMASRDLCAGLRALAASGDEGAVAFWNESGLAAAIAACCGGDLCRKGLPDT